MENRENGQLLIDLGMGFHLNWADKTPLVFLWDLEQVNQSHDAVGMNSGKMLISTCGVTHNFIHTFNPDDMSEPVVSEGISPTLYIRDLGAGNIGPRRHTELQSRERILSK